MASLHFAALTVRLLVFGALVSLLPHRIIPVSVRVGFVVVLLIFLSMLVPEMAKVPSGDTALYLLQLGNIWSGSSKFHATGVLSWSDVFVWELGIGVLLAVSASLSAYGALVLARWISSTFYAQFSQTYVTEDVSALREGKSLWAAIMLIFLFVIFSGSGFSLVFGFVAESLIVFPYESFSSHFPTTKELLVLSSGIAQLVLVTGLVVAGPVLIASLIVDFLFVLLVRLFAPLHDEALLGGVKMSLIVLVLSLSLYVMSSEFKNLTERTLDEGRGEEVLSIGMSKKTETGAHE